MDAENIRIGRDLHSLLANRFYIRFQHDKPSAAAVTDIFTANEMELEGQAFAVRNFSGQACPTSGKNVGLEKMVFASCSEGSFRQI